MAYKRVAAVTGANKGIGLAIVRNLALQYPQSALNDGPFLVYLLARDRGRGERALEELHQDINLKRSKALKQNGGLTDVKFHQLDVSESSSISDFYKFLQKEHPEGIDILVNNAGIAMNGFDAPVVEQTLKCNYYGTLQMTEGVLPNLKSASTSRIVNMSSMVGKLNKYSPALTEAFRNASSVAEMTNLMKSFYEAVKKGNHISAGWPGSAYAVSKAGVTGFTKIIAQDEARKGSKVLINSCCPGYVKTDMTKGGGRKSPDQGAQTPVSLALGDLGGRSGEFWEHEEVSTW